MARRRVRTLRDGADHRAPVRIEWPMHFAPGDVVAWRDPDAGACSVIGVLRSTEEENAVITLGSHALEVQLKELHATPFAYARQALECALAKARLPVAVGVTCEPFTGDAPSEIALRVSLLSEDVGSEAIEAVGVAIVRAGFDVAVGDGATVARQSLACEREPWMSEDEIEHWGMITPEEGGFFEIEDVQGVPTCTVWAVRGGARRNADLVARLLPT